MIDDDLFANSLFGKSKEREFDAELRKFTTEDLRRLRLLARMAEIVHLPNHNLMLKFKHGVRIVSDEDVILMSGRKPNDRRPGYTYAIWENPDLDGRGEPVMYLPIRWADTGEHEIIKAEFNSRGKLKLKAGMIPPPEYDVSFKDKKPKARYRTQDMKE